MQTRKSLFALALTIAAPLSPAVGQATGSASASPVPGAATAATLIPALVPYSGAVVTSDGKPQPGETGITFLIFKEAKGGEPLWTETQTVTCNANGHYEVYLGAASGAGLPLDLFNTGEARWLEVQVAGQAPQPRVLLASVPYAMKAADSATLGGLPASAYALAGSAAAAANTATASPDVTASTVTTPGGTAGYLPVFSGATTIDDSLLFQSGSSLGIKTSTPAATLDVNGSIAARGAFTMEATGTASASAGQVSQPIDLFASAYNSSTKKAVAPLFALQAEAAGNNTGAPSGTLNLLYGNGAAPSETGLAIGSTGIIKFATGQTFPGTGTGTITGVTTTSPLAGSGTSGSVALSLNVPALETTLNGKYAQLGAANTFTAPIKFATGQTFPGTGTITGVTTTSPLAGSGTTGSVALSLNVPVLETTLNGKYAQLGAANTFSAPITFAAGQAFPGTGTITQVTAGTGLTGGGTKGAITLSLDLTKIPTLTSSPVFSAAGNGAVGDTAGNTLGTAGVLGVAGTGNTSGLSGIAGVWGNASQHVGVLGTSDKYAGVEGSSSTGQGVLGTSTSGPGLQGTSSTGSGVQASSTSGYGVFAYSSSGTAVGASSYSGPAVNAESSTNDGVLGYTAGTALGTAGTLGIAGPRTSNFNGIAGIWGDAANHVGVFGTSNLYQGVYGASNSGVGVQGSSTSGNGVYGFSTKTSGVHGETESTSSGDAAVYGFSDTNAMGVFGGSNSGPGVVGSTASNIGVQGTSGDGGIGVRAAGTTGYGTYSSSTSGTAILGTAQTGLGGLFTNNSVSSAAALAINYASWQGGTNAYPASVLGDATGQFGVGVEGSAANGIAIWGVGGASDPGIKTNTHIGGRVIGVWGDTTGINDLVFSQPSYAVVGTASNDVAAYFQNNSVNATVYAYNYMTGDGSVLFKNFEAASPDGVCGFGGKGDLSCTGQIKALATTAAGSKTVETYSVQSPENWMEDFGSGSLRGGVAMITIDPTFAGTVSASADYHVFLTPNGDSKGLYVVAKTPTSFEVRESGGGTSTIAFDYRIVAKRRGYEAQRMVDVTERLKAATLPAAPLTASSSKE